ncbi:MAG: hypothetical protein CL912_04635 [Deltaproteobacteria bacterium]|nr:hypothetical protein [Deltaproteobacteria bacterium]
MLLLLNSGKHSILLLLAQLVPSTSATDTSIVPSAESSDAEDLTRFTQGPEAFPEFIPCQYRRSSSAIFPYIIRECQLLINILFPGPQVPAPISCDYSACRGMSWGTLPYRCRQSDGIMSGKFILGCPCCPRIIACEDPSCEGTPEKEICESELLAGCVCVASRRRVSASPTRPPDGDVSVEQVEDEMSELSIHEVTESNTQGLISNPQICPSQPPVKCDFLRIRMRSIMRMGMGWFIPLILTLRRFRFMISLGRAWLYYCGYYHSCHSYCELASGGWGSCNKSSSIPSKHDGDRDTANSASSVHSVPEGR